jgi:hypothetical protein
MIKRAGFGVCSASGKGIGGAPLYEQEQTGGLVPKISAKRKRALYI